MLIEFRVENHRSIRDEQVLSMESSPLGDPSDGRPRRVPGFAKPLLPVAAIYGANASGKSNILSALGFMREAVVASHRGWSPTGGVPRSPFAWGPKRDEPSFFELTALLDGERFQYGFTATDASFPEEWLYAWPKNRKQVWYERDDQSLKFGPILKGENRSIRESMRPNSLYLATAAQNNHARLSRFYSWFQGMSCLNFRTTRSAAHEAIGDVFEYMSLLNDLSPSLSGKRMTFDLARGDDGLLKMMTSLLKEADVGIDDVRVGTSRRPGAGRAHWPDDFEFRHGNSSDNAWLSFDEESMGTRVFCKYAIQFHDALRDGRLVLFDELESSLHPTLARGIVRQFNDPEFNTRNAQLIFTTHDTNLLGPTVGEPALRRDQVWLAEKDEEGATVLYPLTDYKPRDEENLERGYLQGRFGAIPFLGEFRLSGD